MASAWATRLWPEVDSGRECVCVCVCLAQRAGPN